MSKKSIKRNKNFQEAKRLIIYFTLDEFRNKAGLMHTQAKADAIKSKLKQLLPDDEYWKLNIAHAHFVLGEGATELYDVCKELSLKYGAPFAYAVKNLKLEVAKALNIPQIVEWLSTRLPKK